MKIRANCAARTHENDIRPIAEIVQKTGLPIEAATFHWIESRYVDSQKDWTDDFLLQTTEKAVRYAVSLGLDSMYRHRRYARCDPETVKRSVLDGDQLWGARDCDLRYGWPCHAHGRVGAGEICY